MEKNTAIIKKLVVVAIILAVVTISVISFVGVYKRNLNVMSDIIPDYTYGMEFEGNREYEFTLDKTEEEKELFIDSEGNVKGEVASEEDTSTEVEVTTEGTESDGVTVENGNSIEVEGYTKEKRNVKANDDSVLTPESYQKSKDIIEKRLETLGAMQYNVRLDDVTGKIIVELPDDKDVDLLYEVISSKGEFKIIDSQTGLELMDNSNIKNVSPGYTTNNGAYTVYLQIQFDKDGTQKLKDISNTYIETTVEENPATEENTEESSEETAEVPDETTETENTEAKTETKYIEIKLDDSSITKTYFGEEMAGGYIQIPVNQNVTTAEELQVALKSANAISTIINSGNMPNKYVLENDDFIQSTITKDTIDCIKIGFAIAMVVISVVLLVRFGLSGILGAILNIGYLGLVLLAIRYTNVVITISSIIALAGVIVINTVFMYVLLKSLKNDKPAGDNFAETMKKVYSSIIPICIVAFVFTFMQNASVLGIGSILFWGIIVQAIYSLIFVRSVYVLNDK